jgi:hypothetical protein
MAQDCFAKGVEAFYKDHWGHISFVSEEYITLCIHSNPIPMRDVCIVIHRSEWKEVQLVKQSHK